LKAHTHAARRQPLQERCFTVACCVGSSHCCRCSCLPTHSYSPASEPSLRKHTTTVRSPAPSSPIARCCRNRSSQPLYATCNTCSVTTFARVGFAERRRCRWHTTCSTYAPLASPSTWILCVRCLGTTVRTSWCASAILRARQPTRFVFASSRSRKALPGTAWVCSPAFLPQPSQATTSL